MKNFSELMEGMNLQIKHLAQCLALDWYLVTVSLGGRGLPLSTFQSPRSVLPHLLDGSTPSRSLEYLPWRCPNGGVRVQFSPRQPWVQREGYSARPGPPALSTGLCVWQSELSDGIAMLVAGNDRVQAVITQMEEVCQTIEVSLGWAAEKLSGLLEVDHK